MTSVVEPPLIAHIIYRLDTGGLENGVVNIINNIPESRYRHVVISLTDATSFKDRIRVPGVKVICLNKQPGHDIGLFFRLYKVLRQLRPEIIHTRNLAALECVVPAWIARVPFRIHSEHGWDTGQGESGSKKYQMLRKVLSVFVHRYIALSVQIQRYLVESVGIPEAKITQIYNGVDVEKFSRQVQGEDTKDSLPSGFNDVNTFVIGAVGRMESVKDHKTLARAFIELIRINPKHRHKLRLVLVGDGSMRRDVDLLLRHAECSENVWFAGNRKDVPLLLGAMDVFVLPSLNEGISNTILEAMSMGLPVVATRVGGNAELVLNGVTGYLVPHSNPNELCQAIDRYLADENVVLRHGVAGRERVKAQFSLHRMVEEYMQIYDLLPRYN